MLAYGHKKRGSAESQPFVNLKSNTMKNIAKIYNFNHIAYFLSLFFHNKAVYFLVY